MFTFPVGFFGGSTGAGDPYWSNVVLYLPLTGTNGQTTFTDVSQYGHAVTRNGDTVISTAQFPSLTGVGSSAYFDGNGDWLAVTYSPALNLSPGVFTLRTFFYLAESGLATIISNPIDTNGTSTIRFEIVNGNTIQVLCRNNTNSSWSVNFSYTLPSGTFNGAGWQYAGLTLDGSVAKLWLNGSIVASTSYSGSLLSSTSPFLIGRLQATGDQWYYTGYLSHLEIYNGVAINLDSVPTAPSPIG